MKRSTFFRCSASLSLLSLLLSGCSDNADSPPEIVHARPLSPYYVVKKGETLNDVVLKTSTTEEELISLNNLKPPYKLYERQRILIRVLSDVNTGYSKSGRQIKVKELDDDGSSSITTTPALLHDASEKKVGEGIDPSLSEVNRFERKTDLADSETAMGNTASAGKMGLGETQAGESKFGENMSGENKLGESKLGETAANTPLLSPLETSKKPQAGFVSNAYSWPLKGKVVAKFGQKMQNSTPSEGLYIKVPVGTKVKAVAPGKVFMSEDASDKGFGKIISIKHDDGKMSVYVHLKENLVKKGQSIQQGQEIGRSGKKEGMKDGVLLFQIRKKNANSKFVSIDPEPLLS